MSFSSLPSSSIYLREVRAAEEGVPDFAVLRSASRFISPG